MQILVSGIFRMEFEGFEERVIKFLSDIEQRK